ncbi:MAG: NAD(P)/FAD-dependent oxidoreductase [Akkermansiaceae bacterium]
MSAEENRTNKKPTIAIIGLGISGLGCAHFLKDDADLTLYEANDYIGGHTNTVTFKEGAKDIPIDTGFMVYNEDTYPHLTRLFKELGVETKETSMSFSVNHIPDGLEYNGGKFNQIFGQRKNIFNLKFWKMLFKIKRFNDEALEDIDNKDLHQLTLREYVEHRGYGENFLRWYLVPMASAVWSSPPEKIEQFPAITLLRFWKNHGFLAVEKRKQWRTVCGGAKTYVEKITAPFRGQIQINNPVESVKRTPQGIEVTSKLGTKVYDQVILATHGDDSLKLLADPTITESAVLSAFQYQPNTAVMHTDESVMPKNTPCWASWNYEIGQSLNGMKSSTHYWMNSLQGVSDNKNYFVTINPQCQPKNILKTIEYRHPLFDLNALAAQQEIPRLHQQGKQETNTYFCGAWQRYGFHEDGLLSAVNLCKTILGREVWK